MKIVYIAGASRSGSTLVDRLLGGLPGVVSLGEVSQIWGRAYHEDQLCGCGLPFSQCPFWARVSRQAFGAPLNFDIEDMIRARRRLISNRKMLLHFLPRATNRDWYRTKELYSSRLVSLFRAIHQTCDKPIMVDSSKSPAHGMLLAQCEGIDLTVIHLVRDSRGMAFSAGKVKEKPDAHDRTAFMHRLRAHESAIGWLRTNIFSEILTGSSTRALRVRYEDLMEDPVNVVNSIAQLASVSSRGITHILPHKAVVPTAHTISGNPMRFVKGDLPLRLDDEWATAMPLSDRRVVTALTWPLLYRYGYAL